MCESFSRFQPCNEEAWFAFVTGFVSRSRNRRKSFANCSFAHIRSRKRIHSNEIISFDWAARICLELTIICQLTFEYFTSPFCSRSFVLCFYSLACTSQLICNIGYRVITRTSMSAEHFPTRNELNGLQHVCTWNIFLLQVRWEITFRWTVRGFL